MSNKESVKLKIRELRKKMNLSQDRFAKKIGVSGKTISAYESGRCVPPLKILDKISNIYGETFLSANQDYKENLTRRLDQIKQYLIDLEKILG